jgi:hypothetical protein
MRVSLIGAAAAVVFAVACGSGSADAQSGYTNSVLNGCYSFMDTSVDTEKGALNTDRVGTFCFDGNGNVTAASGHYSNINGTEGTGTGGGATYTVTNTPGMGMGTITGTCATTGFSVNSVDGNGLAHGFQFIQLSQTGGNKDKKCKPGPDVIGGTAYYQGPAS